MNSDATMWASTSAVTHDPSLLRKADPGMTLADTSLDNFHETATAQRSDELARAYVHAINAADDAALDTGLAPTFLSYAYGGVRSRTATKKYYESLRNSFSDLQLQVHENIGVLAENDMVALRTIITGNHTGDYAGVTATGRQIQTSAGRPTVGPTSAMVGQSDEAPCQMDWPSKPMWWPRTTASRRSACGTEQ